MKVLFYYCTTHVQFFGKFLNFFKNKPIMYVNRAGVTDLLVCMHFSTWSIVRVMLCTHIANILSRIVRTHHETRVATNHCNQN